MSFCMNNRQLNDLVTFGSSFPFCKSSCRYMIGIISKSHHPGIIASLHQSDRVNARLLSHFYTTNFIRLKLNGIQDDSETGKSRIQPMSTFGFSFGHIGVNGHGPAAS
jgi:hypothetical protein